MNRKVLNPVASRLVVGLAGPGLTAREEAWLQQWQPAGVILFARNVTGPDQLRRLCEKLRELVPGLEISADQEGGPVSPLACAVGQPPAVRLLGTLDDPALTRAVHGETGRRLADLGISRVWGPVADVMTEARNPVIGARAFGETADLVARHTRAAVDGLLAGGVACCLKHWPDHGSTAQDSHEEPALLKADAGRDRGPLPEPFRQGLQAGADAVMVGHLHREGATEPATLAREPLDRWRRQFQAAAEGRPVLLVADDVTMGALREPMAARGVVLPSGQDSGQGLVDPALLPLAWLEELLAAGLDLRPGPYEESRTRMVLRLKERFTPPAGALAWLDLTPDDRWEVISHGGSAGRADLRAVLQAGWESVLSGADLSSQGVGEFRSLVVTSHRPLPVGWESLLPGLASGGLCLVAGHPSLGGDLASELGVGWSVTCCPDVDWGVLRQVVTRA